MHHLSLQPDAGSFLQCSISLITGGEEKNSGSVEPAKFPENFSSQIRF
jgi:hypothetical protein